ncbi:hypothetical protein, partial [uncultured Candidatus Kuenenia sp.]
MPPRWRGRRGWLSPFGAGDDPYFLLDTVLTVCYTVYMLRVGGRIFSDDVIKRLSETIQKEPCLSRRKLSRLVCEWMDWRN